MSGCSPPSIASPNTLKRRPRVFSPTFEEQNPAEEILETGIKVIDLLAPYAKGGKIGLFGGSFI